LYASAFGSFWRDGFNASPFTFVNRNLTPSWPAVTERKKAAIRHRFVHPAAHTKGRFAIVTKRGAGAMDAGSLN
jgi:hypothetical protein